MKTILKTKELKAALAGASTDESNYVLNGILVELRKGKKPLMVSTNGKFLITIESSAGGESTADIDFILPSKFVSAIVKIAELKNAEEILIANTGKFGLARIQGFNKTSLRIAGIKAQLTKSKDVVSFLSPLIDGQFPNWRQVFPNSFKGVKNYALSPRLLRKITESILCLNPENNLRFKFSDEISACVISASVSKNFQAILMPMRVN
jgi:DNA polymerase III sliding clamp (beta) subunit (PCNA family)